MPQRLGASMQQPSDARWKFSLAILLPVIIAVLITVALAAGFVLWSAGRTDERALERQRALAARMVETAKSDFMVTQTDQALRYEVVDLFLAGKPSAADIDSYFGADEYNTYGHDRVYVLD